MLFDVSSRSVVDVVVVNIFLWGLICCVVYICTFLPFFYVWFWLSFLFLSFFLSRADLIVGAPFYYDRETGGAVYVYSNPPDGGLTANTPYVKLVGKPESRYVSWEHIEDIAPSSLIASSLTWFVFMVILFWYFSDLDSRWPILETSIKIATKTWPWARLTKARASSTFT